MSSLLLVTADVAAAEKIEEVARQHSYRTRTVNGAESAKEWLSMQSFTLMIVDARYGGDMPLRLLTLGWTYHPTLSGAIYSPDDDFAEKWQGQLLGAHIFSGPDALTRIDETLRNLPQTFAIAERGYYGVLVVEDLDAPRDIICAYIESLGCKHVDGAGSVDEALTRLRHDPLLYYAVITDIMMPKRSGIDLIKEMREDKLLEHLPIIVLTAVPSGENLLACIAAGATGFLVKPPKKNSLRAELEKAKRIIMTGQSPRLCAACDAHLLEEALRKRGSF